MVDQVEIPGMYVTREDISLVIYQRYMGLSSKDAHKKVSELTDEKLEDIADCFAQEFFDKRDTLFSEILWSAFNMSNEVEE